MKALFLVLQALLLVFFLGCQENSLTDPGTIDDNTSIIQGAQNAESFTSKDQISSYPRVIVVDDQIYDPTHPANISEPIKGIIRYDHKLVPVYSTPGNNQYRVQIRLYTDLVLDANCPNNNECMKITGSSVQTVDFFANADREGSFEKIFRVRNTCCGEMNLVLKFDTNIKDMSLRSMSLEKFFNWTTAGNSSL